METYSSQFQEEHPSFTSPFDSKILIWNSRRTEAELIEERLHVAGYENTYCATTYAQGLEYLQKELVKVFLIDMHLGQIDGLQLVKALRDSFTYRYTPVLITTTSSKVEDTLNAMKAGANDLLLKPLTPEMLSQKVALHLKATSIPD